MRRTFRVRRFILWWSATIAQARATTSGSELLDSSSSYNHHDRILQDSSIITMEDPTNWCLDSAFNCDCSETGVISSCLRNEDCDKCADEKKDEGKDDSSTTATATAAPCLTTTSSAILLNDNIDYDATTCHSFDNHSWSLCTTQSVRTTSLVETSCEFTYNEQVFCCTTTTTSSCGVEFCKGTSLEGLDICLLLTMECPRLQPVTTTLAPSSSPSPTAVPVVGTASPAPTVVSSNETIAGDSSMNDDDENESDENENNTTSALLFEMEWPAQGLDCSANDEQDGTTDTICGNLDLESSEGIWYKLTGTGKYLEWTPTCTSMKAAALMGNLTVTVLAGNSCDALDCILPPQSLDMTAAVCTNNSMEEGGDDDDDDEDSQGSSTIEIRQRGRRSIRHRQLQATMNDSIPRNITIQTKVGVLYWIYVEGDDDAQEVLLQDFPFEIAEFVPEDEETETTPAPSTTAPATTVVVSPSPTSNPTTTTTTTAPTIMPSSTGTSRDNDDAINDASSSLSTGAIIGIVLAALLLCCCCCVLLLGVYARRNQDDDPEERKKEEAANHNDDDDKSSIADSENYVPEEEDWDEEES